MGFLRGLWAPFRGAAFVARHGLWLYVLAPIALNIALIGGTVALGVHLVRQRMGPALLGSPLAAIGLWVVGSLLGLVFFVILQPVVGAPFVDVLTEKVESITRGEHPRIGVLVAAWRSLWHGVLKLLCYAVALALVLALTTLTGIGGGIAAAVSSVLLAYDGFDFPLARRGASFGAKWKYLLVHPGQTLGYCVGATLLYLVPLAIVVAPAFAAVGATLVFLDTDGDTDLGAAGRRGSSTHATDGGASSR
jgi:CysZ protein